MLSFWILSSGSLLSYIYGLHIDIRRTLLIFYLCTVESGKKVVGAFLRLFMTSCFEDTTLEFYTEIVS